MNRNEEQGASKPRSKRVVSLPCGHQVYVDLDASILAVSGPVLDHQSTCRPMQPLLFPAWFPLEPDTRVGADPLSARVSALWSLFG
jgi:hypothetical protein